jgi:hypothetical protein
MVEVDRMLRPEGRLILRDTIETIKWGEGYCKITPPGGPDVLLPGQGRVAVCAEDGMATKPKLRMHQNQFSFLIPRKKKEGNGERKVAGKGDIVL